MAIAVAAGPLIGGICTTYFSWRWVFIGEVVVIAGILAFSKRIADTPPEEGVTLDYVGTVLSASGLGLIVYGLLRSGRGVSSSPSRVRRRGSDCRRRSG